MHRITQSIEIRLPRKHEKEEAKAPLWLQMLKNMTLASVRFDDRKRRKKIEEITRNLRNNL